MSNFGATVDATLHRAVSRQIIADVPLGAFLSGRVDSSLMQAQSSRLIRTFTFGFANLASREMPLVAAVVRHLGSDHTELTVTLSQPCGGVALGVDGDRAKRHGTHRARQRSARDHIADDASARMMVQDMRSYLLDDKLCKVDRAAMAVSLDTRVPFLDPNVLAASAQLPSQMKIRDGHGKWTLRQIRYRHAPRELIEWQKTGIGRPVGDWLRGPLRGWTEGVLSEENLRRDGLIYLERVRQA